MSKQNIKTTRRAFLAKAGAFTTGLTLIANQINAIRYFGTNPDSLPEIHKNANNYGSVGKAGYFDQIVEVPHDHYIIFPEPKMINKTEGKVSLSSYLVRYSDNTTEKAIMHFGYNVGNLRPPIHSRYPYDVRHVYREKQNQMEWPEAKDGRDITPGAPALYQYEWINPHPGKSISEINFISMGTEVMPALVGLTIRDVNLNFL